MPTKVVRCTIEELLPTIWLESAFIGWNFVCEQISGPDLKITWTYPEPKEMTGLKGIIGEC